MADDSDTPVESVREAAEVLRSVRARSVAASRPGAADPPPPAARAEAPPPAETSPPAAEPSASKTPPPAAAETPPAAGPPPAAEAPTPPHRSLGHAARAVWTWFGERRGVRVALLGLALIVLSVWLGGGSALSLPLLVIGLVVLAAGTLGSRLRGHVNVSWGPDGSALDIHTEVVPPRRRRASAPPPTTPTGRPRLTLAQPPEPVIEGHGETIEMDVGQLQALLAAERAARGDE